MVKAGAPVDAVIDQLRPLLDDGDMIMDGGNSLYEDTERRTKDLESTGLRFIGMGVSGGEEGALLGPSLMPGGTRAAYDSIEPIVKKIAAQVDDGSCVTYIGPRGAGHYVKMVHNAIEYGMMEAIGEGYAVLDASHFKLDLGAVTRVYQQGSVVRSWLIDLCRDIFAHEDIRATSGKIDSTGEGEWTVKTGHELGVDVRVIEDALRVRRESVRPKDQKKLSNKIVALLRKQFGGHAIHSNKKSR
jgi:6-phosphogluconate dehydrogenase